MSKNNLEFFEKNIIKLPKKIKWEIKKIEIYSEKLKKEKLLNFKNNNQDLFYMVKNNELYKLLNDKLLKSKFFKKKMINKIFSYDQLLQKNNYDLIINCEQNNPISKKYFIQRIEKDYKNFAFTTILEHKKLKNNSAIQVFTNRGPVAFLPISNTRTSVVCSLDTSNKNYDDDEILKLINKHNPKFKIKKNSKLISFALKSSNLKTYYYTNILAFGELLHKIHPLAGQGFNMTIRDIKDLSEIIQNKINLGLQLDTFILEEFQNKTKNRNFIFSKGIDFIYEFFNFDKKKGGKNLNKILQYFGTNKNFMSSVIKFADKGLSI
tara:strand:- start:713 stop:1678 length:966 start_codon:yes stop_codon:yes gene_type:complete